MKRFQTIHRLPALLFPLLLCGGLSGGPTPGYEDLEDAYTLVRVFPDLAFQYMTLITEIPDESGRLAVLERTGGVFTFEKIPNVRRDQVTTWLDLRGDVAFLSDQGLLGIAFDPEFIDNGIFYVYYSFNRDDLPWTRLSRFRADPPTAETVERDTEEVLLEVLTPSFEHDGGGLLFGPDGMLYLSIGDGQNIPDVALNAQNTENLLGTVIRIDVRSEPEEGMSYRIPEDNPFVQEKVPEQETLPEIFAYGLRNPFRMVKDPKSDLILIGDVGWNTMEEVNVLQGGANYGWPIREGLICNPAGPPTCPGEGLTPPIAAYYGPGAIIAGGFSYGELNPDLEGRFLFSDANRGHIFTLVEGDESTSSVLRLAPRVGPILPIGWGQDLSGQIYVGDFAHRGGIYVLKEIDIAEVTGWVLE